MRFPRLSVLAPMLAALAILRPAQAQPNPPSDDARPRFHADLEVDPTAYVLDGYSLHAGLGWNRVRLDLGAFAMKVPEAIHGQRDFDVGFDGFGAKLQFFPFAEQSGLVLGADSGVARRLIQRKHTQLAEREHQVTLGLNVGYRIDIAGGWYATPWLGLSRALGATDARLGDAHYESSPWLLFPAVHIGYHLR